MTESRVGQLPEDPEGDREFRALNERARMLAERALFHGDEDAGKELQMLFSPLIVRMNRSVRYAHREDVAAELTATTMRALKQAVLKRKDLPLAYALASIRNEYIRVCVRLKRQDEVHVQMPDGFDRPVPELEQPTSSDTDAVMAKIQEFRADVSKGRSKVDALMAEVIAVCYLNDVSFVEGCALLGLTELERSSLGSRLSREKHDLTSRLNRLGNDIRRIIGGLLDDETLHQPRPNTDDRRGDGPDLRDPKRDGRPS